MNGTKMMTAVLVAGLAGAAAACCPWIPKDQKTSAPGSATEAAVTSGGWVDSAYAAEPAKSGKTAKKKPKAAGYECPQCHMASAKPGTCPMCKVGLVPKGSAPVKKSEAGPPATATLAVAFSVKGMTCEGCKSGVEKALRALPGVEKAEVSLNDNRADVVYDTTKCSPAQCAEAVKKAGFEATVIQ